MKNGRGIVGVGSSLFTLVAAVGWSACTTTSVGGAGDASTDSPIADGPAVDVARPTDAVAPVDAADAVAPVDAADAVAPADAADAADAFVVTRVTGWHVEYDGQPVVGATVSVLSPSAATTTTDASGDFKLTVPVGAAVVVKVTPPAAATAAGVLPMIRGLVVGDSNRIRTLYLAGPPERQAAIALGHTPDAAKGIVEVDFRNAAVGGYGSTLTSGGAPLTPGYGIALDAMDNPVSSTITVVGGGGSTLLLGDVTAAASVAFGITTPAGRTCTPCDASPLPIQAGVVTWVDFECGSATDCK